MREAISTAFVPPKANEVLIAWRKPVAWRGSPWTRSSFSAELTPQSQLQSLGLDSLELMEFVFAVEDRFDLRIPEDRLDPRQREITLGDVARAIDELLLAGAAPQAGG